MKSSIPLTVSLLVNLALAGVACFEQVGRDRNATQEISVPQVAPTAVSERVLEQRAVAPFNWLQLDSADNTTYIANLRNIGCPERVIRLIITDRMSDFYEAKTKEIEGNNFQTVSGSNEGNRKIEALRQEQANAVSNLLGPKPQPADRSPQADTSLDGTQVIVNSSTQQTLEQESVQPDLATQTARVSIPLIFANQDVQQQANQQPLTESQQSVLDGLQQNFVDAIGGTNQNPSAPEYLRRWMDAQWQSDLQYRQKFGWQAFMAEKMQAALQSGSL